MDATYEKPKGTPRTFWRRYKGYVYVTLLVLAGFGLLWGFAAAIAHAGAVAQAERARLSSNAMYVCLDKADGSRGLLLCMQEQGFVFTWDAERRGGSVTVDEFWPIDTPPDAGTAGGW